MRHRPKVRRELRSDALSGVGVWWQCRCTCGEAGPERDERREAVADRAAHLEVVAAPESERCRTPQEHGCGWWDSCPLCSGQEPLIPLEELEVGVSHG